MEELYQLVNNILSGNVELSVRLGIIGASLRPDAPTNLRVANISGQNVILQWDQIEDADCYLVYVNGIESAPIQSSSDVYIVTNVDLSAIYTFTVKAKKNNRLSLSSNVLTVDFSTLPDVVPPSTPGDTQIVSFTSNSITASWTPSTDDVELEFYLIYLDTDPFSAPALVATIPATQTSYEIGNLSPDTLYRINIRAQDATGNLSGFNDYAEQRTAAVQDITAPAIPSGLAVASTSATTVNLTWNANVEPDFDDYKLYREQGGNYVHIATIPAGTLTYQDTGLSNSTTYNYRLSAVDTSMNESSQSAFVAGVTLAASWDTETDWKSAGYDDQQIKDLILKTIGGSYTGTTRQILPDPDYLGGLHKTTAAGNYYRNECGLKVYRLTDFENDLPMSGDLNDLRSEIKVSTIIDANGKFLFYGTHKQFQWGVWEVDTINHTVTFLRETSTRSLDTAFHHTIMPHPTEVDTVMYLEVDTIKKTNLRTGTETIMYTLPFVPALAWGKRDGNGLFDDVIICSETTGPHHCFMLKMSTGEAINTVNGVSTPVPIASRQSIFVTPTNDSNLDHIFSMNDGDAYYIFAVIKNGAGPNGGSGVFIYDSTGFISEVPGSGTGHVSHQRVSFGSSMKFGITWKLNPGNATELGSPYQQGDLVTAKIDISYSGGYTVNYSYRRSLDWQYSESTAAGGQYSGIDSIPDVSAVTMTTAHTDVNNRGGNDDYIDEAFFGKEEMFLFYHKTNNENDFFRMGKNLSRLKQNVDSQTEANLLEKGSDGTLYYVFHSRIGPVKGSTTFVNPNDKDSWLVIIPPMMPNSRIDYYLSL